MILFTGNSNPFLASRIAENLSMELGHCDVSKFNDGEISVNIVDNVRGADVFLIQSICNPTNDSLMELVLMTDALFRASVKSISVILPYFGYARQDRRPKGERVPISAEVVSNMISRHVDRILTLDLHSEQIQGFFDIAVDNIYTTNVFVEDILSNSKIQRDELIIVSPDVGAVQRARALSKVLNCDLAIIDKRRPKAGEIDIMNVIGSVDGKTCLILDDIIDTANTLCKGAAALKQNGAKQIFAYITHPVLSGNAIQNINSSVLDEIVVSDTIPLFDEAKNCQKIRQITVANLLAQCIRRTHANDSLSALFSGETTKSLLD